MYKGASLWFVDQEEERYIWCWGREHSPACKEQSKLGSNERSAFHFTDGMMCMTVLFLHACCINTLTDYSFYLCSPTVVGLRYVMPINKRIFDLILICWSLYVRISILALPGVCASINPGYDGTFLPVDNIRAMTTVWRIDRTLLCASVVGNFMHSSDHFLQYSVLYIQNATEKKQPLSFFADFSKAAWNVSKKIYRFIQRFDVRLRAKQNLTDINDCEVKSF